MKKIVTAAALVAIFVPFAVLQGQVSETALPASDPMTWLVKSVCVDSQNRVLPIDPYGGCPPGATLRKIQVGDPIPYHNVDQRDAGQRGHQQHDSYPLHDLKGNTFVVAPFEFSPFNAFHLFDNPDGYDLYAVQNNWATVLATSAGAGGTTFFGNNCTIGNGWNLFPASGFQNGGQGRAPIAAVHWEQSGQSFPGECPSRYSSAEVTSWQFQRAFPFGGINGNPVKTMDTMISYHGFQPGAEGFLKKGHLEVFYFTKEYGVTRWEVWTPVQQNPVKTADANVPATVIYQGVTFVIQHCRDWSKVIPASSPQIPVWPLPNLNLLQHAHFDSGFANFWALGGSMAGRPIDWSRHNSLAPRDTKMSPIGVSYLEVSGGATGDDKASEATLQKIYQDIPANKFVSGQTYGYGVSARAGTGQGMLQVAVQQLDKRGEVLWSDNVRGVVLSENGTSPSPGETDSVYFSSAFIYKTVKITLDPNAVTIRFYFTPLVPQTFDILDAWLAPWPVPTQGFGTVTHS